MMNRRHLIRNAMLAVAAAPWLTPAYVRGASAPAPGSLAAMLSETYLDRELQATLPRGASLRIVAQSGRPAVPGGAYAWHAAPDGGACFTTDDGGWVYVSNSEMPDNDVSNAPIGGVGALRFDAGGRLVDSYSILRGSRKNCAGGRSLWGTWLSCEEYKESGQVYECDPLGVQPAQVRPAMGSFHHEAVAMDPASGQAYLTEDQPDGCLYRFTPATPGDLSAGLLEVALGDGMRLAWAEVPDVGAKGKPLRYQVPGAARFRGGEGIAWYGGRIFFTTKHDNRVWSLELATQRLSLVYDASLSDAPVLTGVDNVEISPGGEVLVAEDGGDMQIVALTSDYLPVPVVTLHGQDASEITGPAFSPDGRRLYFSSQRGFSGRSADGLTYELTLPAAVAAGRG